MRIERSYRNSIPAAAVYAMSIDPRFQEQKCRDAGALSYEVSVVDGADGATVRARRKLPPVGFPGMLRRFAPSGVTATETIVWGPETADGRRTARLSVDFHGAPVTMTGTITVVPDGEAASVVAVDADFAVHVPLLGRRVESFAAPIVFRVIDAEEATATAWAARGPS